MDDPMINAEGVSVDCGNASSHRDIVVPLTCDLHQPKASSLRSSFSSRRAISRVVVLHNDKIASFSDSSLTDKSDVLADFFDTQEFWIGSIMWW